MEMIQTEKLVYEYEKRDEEGNVMGTSRAIDEVDIEAKEVLEKAKDFVKALPELSHEEQENLAKKMAEDLGIKLGDFMMPIRMAVTGSRVSPPLMGSILILGVEKSIERIERTLKAF